MSNVTKKKTLLYLIHDRLKTEVRQLVKVHTEQKLNKQLQYILDTDDVCKCYLSIIIHKMDIYILI